MQYLLFAPDLPYAAGGASDFVGVFVSEEEAQKAFQPMKTDPKTGNTTWHDAHVAAFDGEKMKVLSYWLDGGSQTFPNEKGWHKCESE